MSRLNTRGRIPGVAVALASFLVLAHGTGCGSDGNGSGTPDTPPTDQGDVGGEITITATLVEIPDAEKMDGPGKALSGYALFCVTFAEEPEAGKGTADGNGVVTITMDAEKVPMGCFVLDDSGDTVAVVLFDQPGKDPVQTILLFGSTDMGTIAVDLNGGTASVDLPGEGSAVSETPVYTPCPTGMWTATIDLPQCPGGTTIVLWIARMFNGDLMVTSTTYNTYMGDQGCGTYSQILATTSYSDVDRKFSMAISHEPKCNGQPSGFNITYGFDGQFNADCSELNGVGYTEPTDPCDENSPRDESPMTYVRM